MWLDLGPRRGHTGSSGWMQGSQQGSRKGVPTEMGVAARFQAHFEGYVHALLKGQSSV